MDSHCCASFECCIYLPIFADFLDFHVNILTFHSLVPTLSFLFLLFPFLIPIPIFHELSTLYFLFFSPASFLITSCHFLGEIKAIKDAPGYVTDPLTGETGTEAEPDIANGRR